MEFLGEMLEKIQRRQERDRREKKNAKRKKEREGGDEKDKNRFPKMPFSIKGNDKPLPTARDWKLYLEE